MYFEIILLAKILVMPGGHGTQKLNFFQALTWPKTLQTRLAIIIDWIVVVCKRMSHAERENLKAEIFGLFFKGQSSKPKFWPGDKNSDLTRNFGLQMYWP